MSAEMICNCVLIPGQEPDQPDADSEPCQEDQGGGGSEASLDLPERAGGLSVPQVSPMQINVCSEWLEKLVHSQARDGGLLEEVQCKTKTEGGYPDHDVSLKELFK